MSDVAPASSSQRNSCEMSRHGTCASEIRDACTPLLLFRLGSARLRRRVASERAAPDGRLVGWVASRLRVGGRAGMSSSWWLLLRLWLEWFVPTWLSPSPRDRGRGGFRIRELCSRSRLAFDWRRVSRCVLELDAENCAENRIYDDERWGGDSFWVVED